MPRTARFTDALRGRRKALAFVGAAAALAGAGSASAATLGAAQPPTVSHSVAGHVQPALAGSAQRGKAGTAGTPDSWHPTAAASAHRPATVTVARRGAASAQRPAAPAKPFTIYDSVTPTEIPAHKDVATYADGNFAVSRSQVAGRGQVLWIDTNGSDPRASALDVEPGDATPAVAASWTQHKLTEQPDSLARIYTMRSEWPAVQAAVNALPSWMHSHVRWWIADPTGVPHIVPGSSATQWYWGGNYDITAATPGF